MKIEKVTLSENSCEIFLCPACSKRDSCSFQRMTTAKKQNFQFYLNFFCFKTIGSITTIFCVSISIKISFKLLKF